MKNKMFYISISFLLLISFFLWQYVFSIYEVEIKVEPKVIYADSNSMLTIEAIPINSFGKEILFREIECNFQFIEGRELVEVIEKNKIIGKLIIKAKNNYGKVVIKIRTNYSIAPTLVEINILKNLT
jgi:hypothetical protein